MAEKQSKKVGFGISQKLLLVLLIVSLVPMICIGQLSHRDITNLSEEKAYHELTAINGNLVAHVNDWVDANQRMLKLNASRDVMRNMLGFNQEGALREIPKIYDWTYVAMTIDNDGNNVARSDGGVLEFFGDQQYFKEVQRGKDFGTEIVVGKSTGNLAMIMATSVKGKDNTPEGVLAIGMSLS